MQMVYCCTEFDESNEKFVPDVFSEAKRFFDACYTGLFQPNFNLLYLLLLFIPPHGFDILFLLFIVTATRQFMPGGYTTKFYKGRRGPEVHPFTL